MKKSIISSTFFQIVRIVEKSQILSNHVYYSYSFSQHLPNPSFSYYPAHFIFSSYSSLFLSTFSQHHASSPYPLSSYYYPAQSTSLYHYVLFPPSQLPLSHFFSSLQQQPSSISALRLTSPSIFQQIFSFSALPSQWRPFSSSQLLLLLQLFHLRPSAPSPSSFPCSAPYPSYLLP